METIHGAFDALQANTWKTDVCYRVFVSAERAVAVRTGGQLAAQGGQAVIAHQFGLLGVLVNKLFLEKRAAKRKLEQEKALELCTMAELLARHPKNFEVPFYAVKRAGLERLRFSGHGPSVARLVIEPQRGAPVKLVIQTPAQLDACRALLSRALAGRLTVDPKLPASGPAGERGTG